MFSYNKAGLGSCNNPKRSMNNGKLNFLSLVTRVLFGNLLDGG
jgi:hypothetical protein